MKTNYLLLIAVLLAMITGYIASVLHFNLLLSLIAIIIIFFAVLIFFKLRE